MMRSRSTLEGDVQASICALLDVERIWWRRMQARTFQVAGRGGRQRPMFVGTPGMADLLATPRLRHANDPVVLWIECKRSDGKGRQSPVQREFEAEVIAVGHYYLADAMDVIYGKRESCI